MEHANGSQIDIFQNIVDRNGRQCGVGTANNPRRCGEEMACARDITLGMRGTNQTRGQTAIQIVAKSSHTVTTLQSEKGGFHILPAQL